jgi:hypothetical protein
MPWMSSPETVVKNILARADITVNGNRKGDITVHDSAFYSRVVSSASLGLGESYVEGFRDIKASTDTMKSYRHIPVIRTNSLKDSVPYQAVPVAIELCNDARDLRTFIHPPSAFYIFGPEDGSLGEKVLSFCPLKIMVPTKGCMNLAACARASLIISFSLLSKCASFSCKSLSNLCFSSSFFLSFFRKEVKGPYKNFLKIKKNKTKLTVCAKSNFPSIPNASILIYEFC